MNPFSKSIHQIKNPDLDLPKGTRNPFLDLKSVFGFTERNTPLVSLCPPECNFQSETKIEPDLRLSREIFTKKCRQQQNFDSDPKEAWHYNHVTLLRSPKILRLYCRLIYMLPMLYVRLTIKVKMGIPESFKVGWYPHKITGSSHLKRLGY